MYKYAIEQSCGKYGIEIGMSQIHSYIKTGKENYLTRNSGNLFIVEGLNNYLKTGTPSNFTRDNNHRENLINCISTDELLKIVSSSLGIKISEQYLNSKEYVSIISSQYINSIYEEKNISAGQR